MHLDTFFKKSSNEKSDKLQKIGQYLDEHLDLFQQKSMHLLCAIPEPRTGICLSVGLSVSILF